MKTNPGLYVHIPFCKTRCPYCDFASGINLNLQTSWIKALILESALYSDSFSCFDTLFLGGGTPSILKADILEELISSIRETFKFRADTEVSIEVNPDDLSKDKLNDYKRLGINRLSLGVQSLSDIELRFLGRRHTSGQAANALDMIRTFMDLNLSIDLIYCLPGQSMKSWQETLSRAVEFQPDHISCYQLTVAEDTEFGRKLEKGQLQLPEESQQVKMYKETSLFLQKKGFIHYEVSNFARSENFRCRHNLKYWQHEPYLGLGPSAHSFQNGKRWWNISDVTEYCNRLNSGKSVTTGSEKLTDYQVLIEKLALGFRTIQGVPLATLETFPNWRYVLDRLISDGYAQLSHGRVLPTLDGYLMADGFALEFLD